MAWKIIRILVAILAIPILLFIGFLGFQTLDEYKPAKETLLVKDYNAPAISDSFTIITWNIGYEGLGEDMDFFYEGGKMVRPSKDQYSKYSEEIAQRIASFDTSAFIFLQEVDTLSHRSWNHNQLNEIKQLLPGYHGYFAENYKAWVPVPILNPMGKVRAGLVTFSKYMPVSSKRVSYESSYGWPMRLFQLKRCYLETRFKTSDGKQLVLVNTHNSAFSDAASLRDKELNTLKTLMLNEYMKGNYVIVGGDWNQNPPSFDTTLLLPVYKSKHIYPGIPSDFIPNGWNYAFDPIHTTNRYVNIPYKAGETFSTLIDFFVISPNVRLKSVKTIPTGFKESDHQPVVINVII